MNQANLKSLKQVSLFILLFTAVAFTAQAQYTLTDDDVVVTDGVIQSCSYDFSNTSIIIPDMLDGETVIGIENNVFEDKGITNVVLPSTLTSIGRSAFKNNSLTSLDLSACTALTAIEYQAFRNNEITSLDLSACTALTSIESKAFSNNALTDIVLPGSITSIGYAAFNGNEIISVNGNASDGIIYARNEDTSTDSTTAVSYGGPSLTITIPANVLIIEGWAFAQNGLTSVDLSTCTGLTILGSCAFYSNNLTSIDLSACTALTSIGGDAFSFNDLTSVDLSACTALTAIEYQAFRNNEITSLDLSACTALTSIDWWAFTFNNLTEIMLPGSLTFIGYAAFNGNEISTVNGSPSDGFIYAPTADTSIDSTTVISYGGPSDDITIPSQVVTIGNSAFICCYLTSVNFGASTALTTIESRAFDYNSLTSIDLDPCISLVSIEEDAFTSLDPAEFTLPTPSIINYELDHWLDGEDTEYAGGELVTDLTTSYTAVLTRISYTITFILTDGTNPIEGATVSLTGYGTAISNVSGIATFTISDPASDIGYSVSATGYNNASGTVSVVDDDIVETVTLSLNTSVNNELANYKIKVYPNPATNVLIITQASHVISNLELYNITGQKMAIDYSTTNKGVIKLNIEPLHEGIYFLQITTQKGNFTKTIVKE